ncbi:unnamed protein product [Onchocerca flexuosa]|uniref:BZIP domain-containing protein n=1 Tax=Onchocerca flexuosa TaxID=387005 RepID=A0A183I0S2_9BILA|nr:unnamed protein product [Onchocerca flexuosa]
MSVLIGNIRQCDCIESGCVGHMSMHLLYLLIGPQNPQRTNLDSEMANLKNQPDKCAIAKRRKENKKAKEAKNSYVVESKDG